MPDPAVQPLSTPYLYWRFIPRKRGGKLYLHKLRLNPVDSGSVVMHKLHHEYEYVKSLSPYRFWDKAWIFWKPVVEVATLSENTADLESQSPTPYRVFVSDRTRNAELTSAFYDPTILSGTNSFIQQNTQFAIGPNATHAGQKALLIGLEMNVLGLVSLVLAGLVLSLGAGILASFWTERVDVGVAVTSGVASVISTPGWPSRGGQSTAGVDADASARTNLAQQPIHEAVQGGHLEAVDRLLELEADAWAREKD